MTTPGPAGPRHDVEAVVLAGGASRRMGHDKAVLELDHQRLVDRLAGRLAEAVGRVTVASGARSLGRDDEVADVPDVEGPLAGLLAGLRVSRAPVVVVVPVDAPHTSPELLLRLADLCRAHGRGAAVAVLDGQVQALHLAIQRASLPAIEARVAGGERSARRLLGWLGALRVDHDGWADVDPEGRFAQDWDHPHDLPPQVRLPSTRGGS